MPMTAFGLDAAQVGRAHQWRGPALLHAGGSDPRRQGPALQLTNAFLCTLHRLGGRTACAGGARQQLRPVPRAAVAMPVARQQRSRGAAGVHTRKAAAVCARQGAAPRQPSAGLAAALGAHDAPTEPFLADPDAT